MNAPSKVEGIVGCEMRQHVTLRSNIGILEKDWKSLHSECSSHLGFVPIDIFCLQEITTLERLVLRLHGL